MTSELSDEEQEAGSMTTLSGLTMMTPFLAD